MSRGGLRYNTTSNIRSIAVTWQWAGSGSKCRIGGINRCPRSLIRFVSGRVAVVVTCDDFGIPPVFEYLAGSKGTVRTQTVPHEASAEAAGTPEVMDAVRKEGA
jgi:hypothetical protein